ncbi:hypothetical protein TNCV_2330251 [Trichonephila clavipes]|nr:hypothetical protein TNCV_2330251 [Trichonephila clavipes]
MRTLRSTALVGLLRLCEQIVLTLRPVKNVSPFDIPRQIVKVYWDEAVSREQVAKWCSFAAEREQVENRNKEASGSPSFLSPTSTRLVLKN